MKKGKLILGYLIQLILFCINGFFWVKIYNAINQPGPEGAIFIPIYLLLVFPPTLYLMFIKVPEFVGMITQSQAEDMIERITQGFGKKVIMFLFVMANILTIAFMFMIPMVSLPIIPALITVVIIIFCAWIYKKIGKLEGNLYAIYKKIWKDTMTLLFKN